MIRVVYQNKEYDAFKTKFNRDDLCLLVLPNGLGEIVPWTEVREIPKRPVEISPLDSFD